MAFTPTYTTAAKVSGAILGINPDLAASSTLINQKIQMAEGVVDATMRASGRGGGDYTFSGQKHGLIEDVTTQLAAFYCMAYDVENFGGNAAAGLTADLLWAATNRDLVLLMNPSVRKFLLEV